MVLPYPHLDVPISVQEDVSELEVAVDDLVSVEVAGRLQDLQHVPPRLLLREALGLADQLREGLETCFGSVACVRPCTGSNVHTSTRFDGARGGVVRETRETHRQTD